MTFDTDVVIGLEIHVSLDTERKLFCRCRNRPSDEPDTNICPVCMGHPGSRPVLNEDAVLKALKLALAFDFTIAPRLVFSRKTYFYPDLAKNFQITQYAEPIGSDGKISVDGVGIGIERIHMEEDPGTIERKSSHSLIDYNRSGTPLCEIVTKPEISSPEQARGLIRKLVLTMRYLGVWDKAEGNLKADLNISVKDTDYTKVEIKGVSGFKEIEDALAYEIERQKSHPGEIVPETRSYDPKHSITTSMRDKETEEDYGYIYESDILPRELTDDLISGVKEKIPELFDDRVERYSSLGLDKEDAKAIASIPSLAYLFDEFAEGRKTEKRPLVDFSRFLKKEVISLLNDSSFAEDDMERPTVCSSIVEIHKLFSDRKINNHSARRLLMELAKNHDIDVHAFAERSDMLIEETDLDSVCEDVVSENPTATNDYKTGKYWAINYLVGQVMKKVKGKAMPDEVKSTLKKKLEEK
ncbi:MAG: Asp-tRNA(Asn)/Glu-tRNA(Gln) amidotransferase subunit GatB [Candidatus Woesearchaeota archaeon]